MKTIQKQHFVSNSFYWDDMTIHPFRGVYDPKEIHNSNVKPYLSLAETVRLKLYLDTKYFMKDVDESETYNMRIKLINNFTLLIYYDNETFNEIIEPIKFKDRLYYPIHSLIDWQPVLEY